MNPGSRGEAILERRGGATEVTIFGAVRQPTGEFACACRIDVAGRQREHVIYGEDSMQAVLLAITFVASRLESDVPTDEHAAWSDLLHLRPR